MERMKIPKLRNPRARSRVRHSTAELPCATNTEIQYLDISQSIENIMDGKDSKRGSIEKVGNRQRNSATIQDEEITISKTSYNT